MEAIRSPPFRDDTSVFREIPPVSHSMIQSHIESLQNQLSQLTPLQSDIRAPPLLLHLTVLIVFHWIFPKTLLVCSGKSVPFLLKSLISRLKSQEKEAKETKLILSSESPPHPPSVTLSDLNMMSRFQKTVLSWMKGVGNQESLTKEMTLVQTLGLRNFN